MTHAFVLAFCIWSGFGSGTVCAFTGEEGTVIAASCEAGEAYIRAGLRPGQHLVIQECRPA